MSAFQKAMEWAGPGLLSGAFGLIGGQRMNRRAARVAREQMAFQGQQQQIAMEFGERMSSTAHQRQMADLRAAGLNPILAAHGGASAPSVGMGSGAMPPVGDPLSTGAEAGVGTALAVRQQRQELRNLRAQESLTKENEKVAREERDRVSDEAALARWRYRNEQQQHTHWERQLRAGLSEATVEQIRAQTGLAASNTALNIARLPREESISRLFQSPLATPLAAALIGGAALTPIRGLVHMRRAGGGAATAAQARLREAQRRGLNDRLRLRITQLREARRRR